MLTNPVQYDPHHKGIFRTTGFYCIMEVFMKTAILVDGGFYRMKSYSKSISKTPKECAEELYEYCTRHLYEGRGKGKTRHQLYRIFYYDCPPIKDRIYHPLLKKQIDLSKTDLYDWMNEFLKELSKKRKVAIRLGKISDTQLHYTLRPEIVKKLVNPDNPFDLWNITENDFRLVAEQKGVDMKIGLDIASMAYKQQVEQIVLISGDSDFVPAAKLARREGIDFVLDSLGSPIKPELSEHIDGLRCCDDSYKIKNQK